MKVLKKVFVVCMISVFLFSGTLIVKADIGSGTIPAKVADIFGKLVSNVEVTNIRNPPSAPLTVLDISLPTVSVTLTVYDNQVTSYFDSVLSNVPLGYDVTDGTYPGWCIEPGPYIPRGVPHQVMLYSTYDPLPTSPVDYNDDDWDKVNYVLNHKNGYAEDYISIAIWYFLDEWTYGLPTPTQTLVDEANLYGEGYVPSSGEIIAILCDGNIGGNQIQGTIFELIVPPEDEYEGLTPGFWKNHLDAWVAYYPGQKLNTVFTSGVWYFPGTKTLLKALNFPGGPFLPGAARILLRAAVAALLNAAHPDVNYPLSESEIISQVNSALNSMNRGTMLNLASDLDHYNNLGCDDL